jgi:hypothetical protein
MKAKVIKTGEIVDVYHEPQHGQITNIYKESVLVNGRMWSEDELDFCIKTNEAPEKLYIDFRDRAESTWRCAYTEKALANDIEYTRTDAFIEKAVKYVANHFLAPGMDNEIKDFINYMKGE